jgi:small subunit ribosomal protein S16
MSCFVLRNRTLSNLLAPHARLACGVLLTEMETSGRVVRTMLMIRLQRVGRKNHAEFRLVATEKTRAAKSSSYVEHLGHYNPHTDTVTFNTERVLHWIENGAQVSDTVHNLLVKEKIIKGEKINVLPKKSPIVKEEEPKEEDKEETKAEETKEADTKDSKETEGTKEESNEASEPVEKPAEADADKDDK